MRNTPEEKTPVAAAPKFSAAKGHKCVVCGTEAVEAHGPTVCAKCSPAAYKKAEGGEITGRHVLSVMDAKPSGSKTKEKGV